jgi:hypothetical protein
MHDPRWPQEYNDLIPPGATLVLELREKSYQALLRGERFFYLGETPERGIAIWLDLTYAPFKPVCLSLSLSLDEIYKIQDRLLKIPLGTGPAHLATDGSRGIVRVSTCQNHEMSMKWHDMPADSWRGVFAVIHEIRDKILHSPDRITIPPRKSISEPGSWTYQDETQHSAGPEKGGVPTNRSETRSD